MVKRMCLIILPILFACHSIVHSGMPRVVFTSWSDTKLYLDSSFNANTCSLGLSVSKQFHGWLFLSAPSAGGNLSIQYLFNNQLLINPDIRISIVNFLAFKTGFMFSYDIRKKDTAYGCNIGFGLDNIYVTFDSFLPIFSTNSLLGVASLYWSPYWYFNSQRPNGWKIEMQIGLCWWEY